MTDGGDVDDGDEIGELGFVSEFCICIASYFYVAIAFSGLPFSAFCRQPAGAAPPRVGCRTAPSHGGAPLNNVFETYAANHGLIMVEDPANKVGKGRKVKKGPGKDKGKSHGKGQGAGKGRRR